MDSFNRRSSSAVKVGSLVLGGGAPVAVQSMTNTRSSDIPATLQQIRELAAAGSELVRVAVPDAAAADAFGDLVGQPVLSSPTSILI